MPISEVTNPDTCSPASQAFPPPSTPATRQTTGLPAQSSGELQLPPPDLSAASTQSSSGIPTDSDGEYQALDLGPPALAQVTSRGLPSNVMADSASQGRPVPPTIAARLPPAVTTSADTRIPCGLPANVNVR